MLGVVVVAPYLGASMAHSLRCFVELEGVRVGVITHEPVERIAPALRERLAGHYKVDDATDPAQLATATRAFAKEWGGVDRLECYLEQLQVPVAIARDRVGIDGLGEAAARNFRDKNRMKETLRAAGVPVARQARLTGPGDARRFVEEVGFPVVLKPLDGAGAQSTFRVTDHPGLARALNQLLPSADRPVQAEAFVRGEEHTFETAFVDGEPVWSASCRYVPGPLEVMDTPWMQWCMLLPREPDLPHVEAFRPVNRQALRALGMRSGLSHMEWFRQADGRPVVSEVGARPPGANLMRLHGLAHGVDMWRMWARLMVHRTWEMPERRFSVGCVFLRGQGHGRTVREVRGWEAVRARLGDTVAAAQLPRPGQPHSGHYEGDGWVIVRHPRTDGVLDALSQVVSGTQVILG
ncbi:MAG: biotin carboxylase [Myxococcota bacterium]|jgi:biotin carboxylase